jgi:hypothetical protein
MSHLDEGTLHALLDGELDLHEVKQIQAHIGSCAACGTRLREVKEFHGESDRLVGVLEMPITPSRRTAVAIDDEPETVDPPAAPVLPPAQRRPPRLSGPAAEPPPLLLPENPDYGRGRLLRRMRWAALVLVTVGAGYYANQMRQTGAYDFDGIPLPTSTSDSSPDAVLSSEEAAAAPAAPAPAAAAPESAKSGLRAVTDSVPKRVAPRAQASPPRTVEPAAAGAGGAASEFDDSANESAAKDEATDSEDLREQVTPIANRRDQAPTESDADVRTEAARALQQLDRERQVDRAAAATAALDSARRREALARPVAAAPAPRTPEQRAQIYLRIGLDEAAKQLGRPVHVIEGRSPLFMGLALGRTSPGADTTRPVVRVVYQDAQGRLILLDQQRLRPGQATSAPGAEPHWIIGELSLHLSGEVGNDVLRNLRPRVR